MFSDMRILHIITSLRTGGAERLVCDLLPRFRDAGHEVSLLLLDGTRTPLYGELAAAGVRIDALSEGWRAMRNPLLLFPLVRYLKKHPADIIHTHNTSCQLLAAAASRRLPLTLVTTEHNTDNRRRDWEWFRPADRWMYRRYRRIICVGEETRSRLLERLGREFSDRTQVVRNGIDLDRFTTARPDPAIRELPGYKITMAAAFRAQKDHATLIRAMALLPENYRLLLAGGAETREDRRTLENCRALVRELRLEERVRFLGLYPDIPGLLAASDAVVLSSNYEGGTPLAVLEGMAAGAPVIASDGDGIRELVEGCGLLFPRGDAQALSQRIRSVCEDPSSAEPLRERCRSRAGQFSISRTAAAYLEIYNNIN